MRRPAASSRRAPCGVVEETSLMNKSSTVTEFWVCVCVLHAEMQIGSLKCDWCGRVHAKTREKKWICKIKLWFCAFISLQKCAKAGDSVPKRRSAQM